MIGGIQRTAHLNRARRGFTLVELFIVTLVLVVLALVLLPASSRRTHHGPSCLSKLRQLSIATQMYVQDYDGKYPPAGRTCMQPDQPDGSKGCPSGALMRGVQRYGYGETWQGGGLVPLYPYVKNWSAFWCSKQPESMLDKGDPRGYYAAFEWLKAPERVRYPGSKVLMLEAYSYHNEEPHLRYDDPTPAARGYHVTSVDGHVKFTDLSTGCSGSSHPSCAGWESCLGRGGNGNYICSGYGGGVNVPDFPLQASKK